MRKFKISDEFTMSDIGLDLQAADLGGLFQAGAEGMFEIILGKRERGEALMDKRIDLRADSLEQLLIDWLSELLFAFDAEGLIPEKFELEIVNDDNGSTLKATVGCSRFDPAINEAEHEIKAVTYYKIKIKMGRDMYSCHVVFDL
jgi:SHS2 domain-containing protein